MVGSLHYVLLLLSARKRPVSMAFSKQRITICQRWLYMSHAIWPLPPQRDTRTTHTHRHTHTHKHTHTATHTHTHTLSLSHLYTHTHIHQLTQSSIFMLVPQMLMLRLPVHWSCTCTQPLWLSWCWLTAAVSLIHWLLSHWHAPNHNGQITFPNVFALRTESTSACEMRLTVSTNLRCISFPHLPYAISKNRLRKSNNHK